MILIGDSLTRQHSYALAALSDAVPSESAACFPPGAEAVPHREQRGRQSWQLSACWTGCASQAVQLRIAYVRSNHLSVNYSTVVAATSSNVSSNATSIHEDAPHLPLWNLRSALRVADVVLLATGAHVLPFDLFEASLRAARNFVLPLAPRQASVLFRTNTPGHGSCHNLTAPFGSLHEADGYLEMHPWYDGPVFKKQNAIARTIFGGAGMLEVYEPSVQRGDAHVLLSGDRADCLHYCLPRGPVLVWVDMLLTRSLGLSRSDECGRE